MNHMKGVEPTTAEAQPKKRHVFFDRPIMAEFVFIVLLLMGLFLLRKSRREQIMRLWDRKWHKTGIVEQRRFMY